MGDARMLDPEFLQMLVCPACKGDLKHDSDAGTLECLRCRLRYRIKDEIPIMLVEEAERF